MKTHCWPVRIPSLNVCFVEVSSARNGGRKGGFVQQACNGCYAASSLTFFPTFPTPPLTSVSVLYFIWYILCFAQTLKTLTLSSLLTEEACGVYPFCSFACLKSVMSFSHFSLCFPICCVVSVICCSLDGQIFKPAQLVFEELWDQRVSGCIADLESSTYLEDRISLASGRHPGTSQGISENPHFLLTCAGFSH